jgi:hypothetical protein
MSFGPPSPLEALPRVDEHYTHVRATPERTWDAVMRLVRSRLLRPAPSGFIALWHLEPTSGFVVTEETAPRHLALRGRHRFSRYELSFEIRPGSDGVTLGARTSAEFPGLTGRAYRALVIGTGGHRIIVNRMLNAIARSAELSAPPHPQAHRQEPKHDDR